MKERITNETIFLIQQKGFSFTISDLAKNLGTSKRTIYQHFGSKDAIIDSIIENLILQIKNKEEEIFHDESLNLLEKITQVLICVPEEFNTMDIRLLVDLKRLHYNQWVKIDEFLKQEWGLVVKLMEEGIETGVLREVNLQLFIELYLGVINQIYQPSFSLKTKLTLSEILKSVIDILLNGISIKK
ncbi:TetR/AcrR family transcriptional regulator [Priestia aryabhattai]|uniref:TetR/AcrR family transcriptional regulator n=1 Tax=Priestia aryabhattai TaxID=412384 RepID=UPI001C8EE9EB|nr:TetR/AcrR family transcriptional regulator [Priestia aryabhattai]MBX9983742.1 TetR/AcrR family transcriptional regulator [Priestia aryabhattai]MBY0003616.1 TetR/AcrR family transcriptional regulator [Priestia aryabhattai]